MDDWTLFRCPTFFKRNNTFDLVVGLKHHENRLSSSIFVFIDNPFDFDADWIVTFETQSGSDDNSLFKKIWFSYIDGLSSLDKKIFSIYLGAAQWHDYIFFCIRLPQTLDLSQIPGRRCYLGWWWWSQPFCIPLNLPLGLNKFFGYIFCSKLGISIFIWRFQQTTRSFFKRKLG